MDPRWLTSEPKQTRWKPPKWQQKRVTLVLPDAPPVVGKGADDSTYGPFDPPGYGPPPPDNSTYGPFDPQGYGPDPDQAIRDQEAQAKLRAQAPSDSAPPAQPPEDRGWPGQVSDWASGASQGLGNMLHAPEAAQQTQRALQGPPAPPPGATDNGPTRDQYYDPSEQETISSYDPNAYQAPSDPLTWLQHTVNASPQEGPGAFLNVAGGIGPATGYGLTRTIEQGMPGGEQGPAEHQFDVGPLHLRPVDIAAMAMDPTNLIGGGEKKAGEGIERAAGAVERAAPIAAETAARGAQGIFERARAGFQKAPDLVERIASDVQALDQTGRSPNDPAYWVDGVQMFARPNHGRQEGESVRDFVLRLIGRDEPAAAEASEAVPPPSTNRADYLYTTVRDFRGDRLQGTPDSPVWFSDTNGPIGRPGEEVFAVRKDALDPALLTTAANGYPTYAGEIPPEAMLRLGTTERTSRGTVRFDTQGALDRAASEAVPPTGEPPRPPAPPGGPPQPPEMPPEPPPGGPTPPDGESIAEQIRRGMAQGPTPEYDPRNLPPGVPRPKVDEIPGVEANAAREVLPEMAGTTEQAAQLRPPEEGHIGNVSAEPFPAETQPGLAALQEVDELNNFAGARQGVRSDEQTWAEAEHIANTTTVHEWLNKDPHQPLTAAEHVALGQTIVQQELELRRLTARSADTMSRAVTPEDLVVARQHQLEAADQALTLATLFGLRQGTAAESGRAQRVLGMALDGKFGSPTSAQFLDRAFAAAGLNREEMTKFIQTYAAIPADDYVSRYRALAGLNKPGILDKIFTYTVSNILSGPPTTAVVLGHGTMLAYSRPMLTAVRDGDMRTALQDLGAMNRAWGSALPGMWQAFREGVGPTTAMMHLQGGAHEVNPLVFGGKSGMIITPALRTIAAMHEFFNTISLAGATEIQAQRIFNEVRPGAVPAARSVAKDFYNGLKMTPQRFQAYVGGMDDATLLASIRQNMPSRALAMAQDSVRQTVTGGEMSPFGKSIAYMRRFADSDNVGERWFGRAAQFVFPFVRYPDFYFRNGAKILAGPVAYPLLAAKHVASAETRGLVGGDLRMAGLTSAVMTPIVWNAFAGNITGPGPKNPDQRAALMASREPDGSPTWRPLSVRLAGRWVPYTTLGGVLSIPMAAVGAAVEAAHQPDADFTEPIPNEVAKVFGAVVQTLADQNTFSQYADLMQQIGSGPDLKKFGEGFVAGGIGRFVPYAGATRQVAIASDPNVKAPQDIGQRIEQNIPGLRQQVPNRLSPFGEQLRTPYDIGMAILRAEGPAADLYNPALRALTKLGITPGAPDDHLVILGTGAETKLTKPQRDQWQQQLGHTFASLWSKLSPAQQQDREAMAATLSKARGMTTENFKASLTPDQIREQTTMKLKGDPRSQKSAIELASELKDVKRFPEYANPQTGAVQGSPADWARWDQVLTDKATPDGTPVPTPVLDQIRAAKTAGLMKRDSSFFDVKRDATGNITDVAVKDPRYTDYNRWFGTYRGLEDETYLKYERGDTPRYRNASTGAVASTAQADAADRWLQLYRDTPATSPLHRELRQGALARMRVLTPNWENQLRQIDRADLMEEAGVIAEREQQFAGATP